MNVSESIWIALDAVRSQKMRSSLTLLSIGIGVFAIIASTGITGTLQNALTGQLADLGENSFLIQRTPTIQFGNSWRKYRKRPNISLEQANEFKERMTLTNLISVSNTSPGFTIKSGLESTNPDVSLIGIDEMYFLVNAPMLRDGRPVTEQDVALISNVALVGTDVVKSLFSDGKSLGRSITIKNQEFTIVGELEPKGGVLGQSQDNRVLVPISVYVKYYTPWWDASVDISVKSIAKEAQPATMDEAIGAMRLIRECKPWDENNFELDGNEAIGGQFANLSVAILAVAWISGIGALAAAGIGIMNMMLVSVQERTREIGVRKALGAKRKWIVRQFLVESVTLCQLGGLTGVIGGIGTTWLVSYYLQQSMPNLQFEIPWFAVVFSVVVCTMIGIGFGLYPAYKAAGLDPIEALRHE
ncbi:MAG: ABC transporter permease [Ignavibacteria bacterium]|nr:ABC transporter permease [Ignavibacteria bacterium]